MVASTYAILFHVITMRIVFIPLAAILSSMILSAGETLEQASARQNFLDEKEIILRQICKIYELNNQFADAPEAFEARKKFLEFKRDVARDNAAKIKFQQKLVNEHEKYARRIRDLYNNGEIEAITMYKVRLSLLDAKEYLRQLEQQH